MGSKRSAGSDGNSALSGHQLVTLHKAREDARAGLRSEPPSSVEISDRVAELGLESHAFELDSSGYTVIPPEKVAPPEFVKRVSDTILRVAQERTGVPHAVDKPGNPGRYLAQSSSGNIYLLWYLLFEDEVFEEWLENPVLGAIVDYLLNGQGQLSSMMSIVRWRNPDLEDHDIDERLTLGLHADAPGSPQGIAPAYQYLVKDLVCNAALVLTPYTREDGAIAMVPGSHRSGRQPRPREGVDEAVPVEAGVGSLIVWRGGTWHGVFKRTTPGIRLNVTTFHCHRALKTQGRYQWNVPREMLARRSARFARTVGADDLMGWDAKGPDYQRTVQYRAQTVEAAEERRPAD